MSLIKKKVDVDIDGDGIPDMKVSLKEILMILGGIISLVMTYTTLKNDIEKNKTEIEVAKTLPPKESHNLIDQKIMFLQQHIEAESNRLDKIEDKIYKR
jgi:hypothetical protein|tara:strand:+ start:44 stop:340 length:297 start_codon:yes stop_codon:yes gene_type:complete